MSDRKTTYLLIGIAMVFIFILELVALALGFNGTILKMSLAGIGVLGGYVGRDLRGKHKGDFQK